MPIDETNNGFRVIFGQCEPQVLTRALTSKRKIDKYVEFKIIFNIYTDTTNIAPLGRDGVKLVSIQQG